MSSCMLYVGVQYCSSVLHILFPTNLSAKYASYAVSLTPVFAVAIAALGERAHLQRDHDNALDPASVVYTIYAYHDEAFHACTAPYLSAFKPQYLNPTTSSFHSSESYDDHLRG